LRFAGVSAKLPRDGNRCSRRCQLGALKGRPNWTAPRLQDVFRVPGEKIDLIPHGIPELLFAEPKSYKVSFSTEGKTVLFMFGLLSPNKGFEKVIQAWRASCLVTATLST
jgi:glycosyltransferase involved in cell wall biosynthesis